MWLFLLGTLLLLFIMVISLRFMVGWFIIYDPAVVVHAFGLALRRQGRKIRAQGCRVSWRTFRPQNRRDSNGAHLYCVNHLVHCINILTLYWFCAWLLHWLLICNIQRHYSITSGNFGAFYTCNFRLSPFVWLFSLAEWGQPGCASTQLWAAIYLLWAWQPFLVCCGLEFHIFVSGKLTFAALFHVLVWTILKKRAKKLVVAIQVSRTP